MCILCMLNHQIIINKHISCSVIHIIIDSRAACIAAGLVKYTQNYMHRSLARVVLISPVTCQLKHNFFILSSNHVFSCLVNFLRNITMLKCLVELDGEFYFVYHQVDTIVDN